MKTNFELPLPEYRCHKKVHALKIQHIQHKSNPDPTGQSVSASYGANLTPNEDAYASFDVTAEYMLKHKPEVGGYYVLYEDGYASYSPAAAFESGYTPVGSVLSNPLTGAPRDPRDVASDPQGILCVKPGEPIKAAPITLPVVDPGPDSLEREIQAKADKGPRVTPSDIEAEIAAEFYFTAADGVLGQSEMGTRPAAWTNLDQVTICTLVLRNGAKVLGVNYGAIDRAQHDAGKGREAARSAAVEQIWPLLGFRLRDQLAYAKALATA